MKPKLQTIPNLADNSPVHQAAIAAGDDHFRSWQYNVADHFKDKTVEEIKQTFTKKSLWQQICKFFKPIDLENIS